MNTYIQNKLDDTFRKIGKVSNIHPEIIDEFILLKNEALTDYHNHIVEILEKERQTWAKESIGEIAVKSIMARLQDTNPKEYESK